MESRRVMRQIGRTRPGRTATKVLSTIRLGALCAVLVCSGLFCAGVSFAEQRAGRGIDPNTVTGCCACRVPGAGSFAVKSCADDKRVADCVAKCKSEGASSIAFGYAQTCAQGCAGFPTAGH